MSTPDPMASYLAQIRANKAQAVAAPSAPDPMQEYLAKIRAQKAAGGAQTTFGGVLRALNKGAMESVYATAEGIGRLGNALTPGNHVDIEALDASRSRWQDRMGIADTGVERAAEIGARLVGDVTQFMIPGAAAGRAGLIPKFAAGGAKGLAQRAAVGSAVAAPVTVAQAANPEASVTTMLARSAGLRDPNMAARIAGDLLLDTGLGAAVEGGIMGYRATRSVLDRARDIGEGVQDAIRASAADVQAQAAPFNAAAHGVNPQRGTRFDYQGVGGERIEAPRKPDANREPTPDEPFVEPAAPAPAPVSPYIMGGKPISIRPRPGEGVTEEVIPSTPAASAPVVPAPTPVQAVRATLDSPVIEEAAPAAAPVVARGPSTPADLGGNGQVVASKSLAPPLVRASSGAGKSAVSVNPGIDLDHISQNRFAVLFDMQGEPYQAFRTVKPAIVDDATGQVIERGVAVGVRSPSAPAAAAPVPAAATPAPTPAAAAIAPEAEATAFLDRIKAGEVQRQFVAENPITNAILREIVGTTDPAQLAARQNEWASRMRGLHKSVVEEWVYQRTKDLTPEFMGGRGLAPQRAAAAVADEVPVAAVADEVPPAAVADEAPTAARAASPEAEAFEKEVPIGSWDGKVQPEGVPNSYEHHVVRDFGEGGKHHVIVYRDAEGRIAGYLDVLGDAVDSPNATIHVQVRPDLQRQGIATEMYSRAGKAGVPIEELSARGVQTADGAAFREGRLAKAADEEASPEVMAEVRRNVDAIKAAEERLAISPSDPFAKVQLWNAHQNLDRLAGKAGFTVNELQQMIARAGAGGIIGAPIGAAMDEENRGRGALRGAIAGATALGSTGLKGGPALARGPTGKLSNPAIQRVLATVSTRSTKAPTFVERAKAVTGREGRARAYTALVDATDPLKRWGKAVTGDDRLANLISRFGGWQAAANRRLEDRFKNVVLKATEGIEAEAEALASAERALELARNGFPEKGVDLDDARVTVAELGNIPDVRKAADALTGYYRELLDYQYANGVIDDATYQAYLKKGEVYIPFVRDFGEETGVAAGRGSGGRLLQGTSGQRKMTSHATDKERISAFKMAVLDTMEVERRVAKQRVTNMVANLVENHPDAAEGVIRRIYTNEELVQRKARELMDGGMAEKEAFARARKMDLRDSAKPGARTVQANVNGKRVSYEVIDPEVYKAWASFEPSVQNIFVSFLSPFKRVMQTAVTALPDFAIANAIRDNVMTMAQYPLAGRQMAGGAATGAVAGGLAAEEGNRLEAMTTGAVMGAGLGNLSPHIARTLHAMRDIMAPALERIPVVGSTVAGNADMYAEWLREGGAGFGFYARTGRDAEKVLQELRKRGITQRDFLPGKTWWEALGTINRVIEQAPRLARYKYLHEAGEDMSTAVAGSRDISLDFNRRGADMGALSATVAFLNPQVQGWDKLARMLNPATPQGRKTAAIAAASITAPSLALWNINKDDPEYQARPLWEKNMFWHLPTGVDNNGRTRYMLMPKPFEIGFIFATIPERMADYWFGKSDKEAFQSAMGGLFKQYGFSSLLPVPTALAPSVEVATNKDMFRDRPVVGVGQERVPAGEQFDQRTSSVSLGLGRLGGAVNEAVGFGLAPESPQKIDHIIRGHTGSIGREALNAVDLAAQGLGLDERAERPKAHAPLVGRFIARSDVTTETEASVRRRYMKGEKAWNGFNNLKKGIQTSGEITPQDEARIQKYVDRHREDLGNYLQLKKSKKLLDIASDGRRAIAADRTMTPAEKREAIIQLNQRVSQVLRELEEEQ